MNLVSRQPLIVVIRQIPVMLLVIGAFFSFPFLAFSLFHLIGVTDADGT